MREQVAARPGITARELVAMLSVPVMIATVYRRLIQLGLRFKKAVAHNNKAPPSARKLGRDDAL